MSSRLIIAGAGSGKTTWLVNQALKIKNEKVLITTFTDANEQGIREKFFELNGCIPANINIMTWFAFLLRHGVKPYQSVIYKDKIKGLLLVNSKSGYLRTSANISNKAYGGMAKESQFKIGGQESRKIIRSNYSCEA